MNPHISEPQSPSRSGYILFYALGIVALLSVGGMIAASSSILESRTASNHLDSTRALYHAEAGVKLVKRNVENRLVNGESLESILSSLSVSAPNGIEFDPITSFQHVVPDRLFSFESIGRSNDAMASVVVQYRRRPLMQAGLFGANSLQTKPNVNIFGYDSRLITDPQPSDSNAGASIGSNISVNLGNNLDLDGSILLGESNSGLVAGCSGCTNFVQIQVGYVDPDPLGMLVDSGSMYQMMIAAQSSNNNAAIGKIVNNQIDLGSNDSITLTAGDYYLTRVHLGPKTTMTIDDSDGPVRIFLAGTFNTQPNGDVTVKSGKPFGFQIYSNSLNDVNLQPNGNMTAFIYAPNAMINLQPGNDVRGAFWGKNVNIQPGNKGVIWLDTSLAERMLANNLEIHAWYEQHEN